MLFKYPIKYDNDDEFEQKVCNFIAEDLSSHPYHNLNQASTTFFIDIVNDTLQFVMPDYFKGLNTRSMKYK